MAQPKPISQPINQILKLVDQLSAEEQEELLQEMQELQKLRRKIKIGIEQLDCGEGIPGDVVFKELRERNAEFTRKKSTK